MHSDLDDLDGVFLLWDIDGTLITHAPSARDRHAHAVSSVLQVQARPIPAGTGKTDRQIVTEIIAMHAAPSDEVIDAVLEVLDEVTADDLRTRPVLAINGVQDILAALASAGFDQRLLTGNTPRRAEIKVASAGLGGYFPERDGFYGDRHATRYELVAEAASVLGPNRVPRTLIIGDTPLDILAARSAGFAVISVATGTTAVDDLATHDPDALLADFQGGPGAFLAAVRSAL